MKKYFFISVCCATAIFCKGQTIPVVVHVKHTGQAIGDQYNPSEDQIEKTIKYLNKVYNGTAAGTELGIGNIDIQFALAKRDQNGNCTKGITRTNLIGNANYVQYGVKYESDINNLPINGMPELNLKSNQWNYDKYLNIWLVNKISTIPSDSGTVGYSSLPSALGFSANRDGIVIISTFFAIDYDNFNILSAKNLLAHETGHYLNLYHVFQSFIPVISCLWSPLLCGFLGDECCDTHPVNKYQGIPRTGQLNLLCPSNNYNFDDYTERNIMSYTTEPVLFTPDQKERITKTLDSIIFRNSLITNNNALTPPIADLNITEQTNNNAQIPIGINSTNITIQYKETNIGALQASANYVSFHLSSDSILTPGANGDTFLGDTLLNSLGGLSSTALLSKQLSIPGGKPIGEYYIFISADGDSVVSECSEENNFATTKLYIVDTNSVALYRFWFDNNFAAVQNGFAGYANINNLQFDLPMTQLSTGVHQLNIQFREIGAGWSSISSSLFYKTEPIINGSSKYQYWFDDNFAGAYTQNIPAAITYDYSTMLDITSLTNGVHTIHYRFITSGTTWSAVNSSLFYKFDTGPLGITGYQYWFDNSIADSVTVSVVEAINIDLVADINIPNAFPTGSHAFNIRYRQDGGLWSVVQTDSFFSCSVIANVSSDTICSGQSVTLYGSGALNYTWTGGVVDNIPFYPNATQTYTVTGTTANGCIRTSTITIQVNQSNASTIISSICFNQVPYLWNALSIDSPGTYNATLVNAGGCDSFATLVLNISLCGQCQPDFTVNWTPYTEALTESQSWIVTSGTVLVPAGSHVKFDANTSGSVTLNPGFKADYGAVFIAQAFNGCTPGSPQLPPVAKIGNGTSSESNEIILYPNPTTGMVHITHDTKVTEINIFDMVGKMIIQYNCEGQSTSNIDLSNLPNGVYHVKAAGYNSIKLIKNN